MIALLSAVAFNLVLQTEPIYHCEKKLVLDVAEIKFQNAMTNIQLNGRLKHVMGPEDESFEGIVDFYGFTPWGPMDFLIDGTESQAYLVNGKRYYKHPLLDFHRAFPADWHEPDLSDGQDCLIRHLFTYYPIFVSHDPKYIQFRYYYSIEAKDYYGIEPTEMRNGEFKITLREDGLNSFVNFK